jgi:hypothetical protein
MRTQSDPAHVVMPGVHRIASPAAALAPGHPPGCGQSRHLDAYLNKFTFRFNRSPLAPPRPTFLPAARPGDHG